MHHDVPVNLSSVQIALNKERYDMLQNRLKQVDKMFSDLRKA